MKWRCCIILALTVPPMMQPLNMPNKITSRSGASVFKLYFSLIFVNFLITSSYQNFIWLIFVTKNFNFKFFLLNLNKSNRLNCLNRNLPLNTFKCFLLCFGIKFTFTVKKISLCQYEESLLQWPEAIFFYKIAMVLITIRLFYF